MKRILCMVVFAILSLSAVLSQNPVQKNNPLGSWKFEAPYAPEGFTTGKIEVGMAESNYTASISFAGSDYKIKGEKTKYENNTLSFNVFVDGTEVAISLKMENEVKMAGKAVYYEGEIPITLSKEQQPR